MVTQEQVARYVTRNVVRCDKCCRKLDGVERQSMKVLVFNTLVHGTTKVKQEKYHLCEQCGFDMQYDMDSRRERVRMGGVTEAEQEFLLKDLFSKKRRK